MGYETRNKDVIGDVAKDNFASQFVELKLMNELNQWKRKKKSKLQDELIVSVYYFSRSKNGLRVKDQIVFRN